MVKIIPRFFKSSKGSFFLFGPRGTGKSTWLKKYYANALWIDMLDPESFRNYSARPERLKELILGNPDKKEIVIDEVQKVPELLDVVHSLIEKNRAVRFILTGSSSRKLKRAGVDLLAGRAIMRSLHPFMAVELGKMFNLNDALEHGLLPLVFGSNDKKKTLEAYAALYVREEVKAEGLVRNIGNFSRFLEAASFSHGSILNISNIARECQVERKVVESYIGILEDLMLSYRIPVFSRRAKRTMASHPKFYFFDAGLFQTLRPKGHLDRPEEIMGAALEGLVAQHLIAWNSYHGNKNSLFYWRTRGGSEIDFVLYGEETFWAIEVKNSSRVNDQDLRSLLAFKEDYPECQAVFLYRGKDKLLKKGISCVPCEQFLVKLNPNETSI